MRTRTVVIAVVLGVAAGLGKMPYQRGRNGPAVAATERAAMDTRGGPMGAGRAVVTAGTDAWQAYADRVVSQADEVSHGAGVQRTYSIDPTAHATPTLHSLTLQQTDDGSWRIVQTVRHTPAYPGTLATESAVD